MTTIALLPGDGIGSEVLEGPVAFLRELAGRGLPITLTGPWPYGSSGWKQTGSTLPGETLAACRAADVILSGAVGTHPGVSPADCPNPEAALIELRHVFDLRISVRTVWIPGGEDVIVVRNITGGAYVNRDRRQESDGVRNAQDLIELEPGRVREVLEIAADYSRRYPGRKLMSADKASVFATSRLWRRLANEVFPAKGLPFVNVNIDRAAFELVKGEALPAVVVTEGIFGDILSDILCARAGSPALCGSATINPDRPIGRGTNALFEPAHGSSPHRMGSRRSNPTGAWLALASLLDWCPDLAGHGTSRAIRDALAAVHAHERPTYDLAANGAPTLTMDKFNECILAALTTGSSARP